MDSQNSLQPPFLPTITPSRSFSLPLIIGILIIILLIGFGGYFLGTKYLNQIVITLERKGCYYGSCPAYKLTINSYGLVVYEGTKNVKVTGRQMTMLNQEKVQQLVYEINQADFFSLPDSPDSYGPGMALDNYGSYKLMVVPDGTSVIISATVDGKSKTINHYHGDMRWPKKLTELENKIDEIANSNRWVGYKKTDQ